MTIQKVNIGNIVNDGLGDDLPTAFKKVNENFEFISSNYTIQGVNLAGIQGGQVFRDTVYSRLQFRNILPGRKITVDQTSDSIIINSTQEDSFLQIETNNGRVQATASPYLKLLGTHGVSVEAEGSTIRVKGNAVTQIVSDFGTTEIENNTLRLIGHNSITTRADQGKIVVSSTAFDRVIAEDGSVLQGTVSTDLRIEGRGGILVKVDQDKLIIDNPNSMANRFDFGSGAAVTDAVQLLLQVANIDFNALQLNVDFSKID